MNSLQKSGGSSNEEEDMLLAMQLCGIEFIAYGVKTARELDLLEIMAKARPLGTHLSTLYLASKAAPNNPDAPMMIDRLLRLLVAYSVCTCKLVKDEKGRESRTYGLGNVGKKFIKDEHGISIAPYVLFHCSHTKGVTWSYLTESILEGGASAWEKAKGALVFEYMKENESLKEDFNESMMSHTTIVMNKILENYDGFESLRDSTLVDVGGGIGTNLGQALSKFPHLKGINFDLPHIVSKAPQIHGVEHIGGDMFDEIPRGQAMLMKWILHDWSDEKCVEILRNCKKAIPETGRVIVIETIVPREVNNTDIATKNALHSDIGMMCLTRGGRERTKEEFEVLAMKGGFKLPNFIYGAYSFWVLELYPKEREYNPDNAIFIYIKLKLICIVKSLVIELLVKHFMHKNLRSQPKRDFLLTAPPSPSLPLSDKRGDKSMFIFLDWAIALLSLALEPALESATLGEASTEWPALSSKYIGCKKHHKEVVRKSIIASKYATPPVVTLFPTDKDESGNKEPTSSYYSRVFGGWYS
ncbi:BnaC01g22350D [Brassica napus]|uniref:BnaC01g22350D protein n=3 Tax=Brassica TaxID=3705 RepID=A0A078IQH9_BRANA|nr:BnaC01g22350D [Brassica napus]